MDKNKKTLFTLIGLGVLSLLVWAPQILSKPPKAGALKSINAQDVLSEQERMIEQMSKVHFVKEIKGNKDIPWGDSPFAYEAPEDSKETLPKEGKTLSVSIDPHEALKLSGIFWNANKPSVLINDVVMVPGGKINGFEIKVIKPDKIIVFDGKNEIELKLKDY